MTNSSFRIPRAHLVMALCLPLAVILGYMLVDPLDPGSLAVVTLVLAVLSVPLLMKWCHPLLIICWNAVLAPAFLPGQPDTWTLLAAIGLFFAILNRAVDSNRRFIDAPSIRTPLLCLAAVVVITGCCKGGIGFGVFGSTNFGGKRYFYTLAAVMGYFALTSQAIPLRRAGWLVGLFFLSEITGVIPNLVTSVGGWVRYLYLLFPAGYAVEQIRAEGATEGLYRIFGLSMAATGGFCFLLSRYGLRGIFQGHKYWRLAALLLVFACCLFAGFRSVLILFLLIFAVQFYFEKLYRTRLLWILVAVGLVAGSLALTQVQRLPFYVQRTLSFLPISVNPEAQQNADATLIWRLQMWQSLLPEVPKHLLLGKGFSIAPSDLFFSSDYGEWAATAGDYHSGPLSLILPLGIWGVLTFGWFCWAALRYLYRQHCWSHPELQAVNTFLLTLFVARLVTFLLIFGSFYSDLFLFTGIIGLSVSLNGQQSGLSFSYDHRLERVESTEADILEPELKMRRLADEVAHETDCLKR